jgi:hypothetical protein
MKKILSGSSLALMLFFASCAKDAVVPTPQPSAGISAEMLAVLKKHHASYSLSNPTSVPTGKLSFKNARELDSVLTEFEQAMKGTKLVNVTSAKKDGGKRLAQGIGSKYFAIVVPPGMYQSAIDPMANVETDVSYTFCTGDGLFRSATVNSRLNGTTMPSDSRLSYDAQSSAVNVYGDQIRFSLIGHFTYILYGGSANTTILVQTEWSQRFDGAIGNGTSEFESDGSRCESEAPANYSGGGGGGGGDGGGGGSEPPATPSPSGPLYPTPIPSGGGTTAPSGGDGTPKTPPPPPPTEPVENV